MRSADALTPQQQAVVHHGEGPALVLAVPGAGKTTALVHRVRVLIEAHNVAPDRILACSFSRDTVDDLAAALDALDVRGVDVRTLHSLGHRFLPDTNADPPAPSSPSAAAHQLARRARQDLADEQGVAPDDLDISAPDLVDQIAAWKQQLAYADLDAAALPPAVRDTARQAEHENEDVLRLYERFEAHRRRTDLRTYPDMLRDGWERLMQDDALRTRAQNTYQHVLVDEFQDVSRAQFEILDCLTANHRNYMAVGDDDQCIYRWRGAQPGFLLNFADRYDAATYSMTASFRLPLAPLTLANATIQHNDDRHPKQIQLTRGVEGPAECLVGRDAAGTADRVANTVTSLREEADYDLSDMVVLVRTYGQTPPLERALIDRDLPYRIRGRPPFYRRSPVQTLLRYLYWAVLERRHRHNGLDDATTRQYTDRFAHILNHPNRYIQREWIDAVTREAVDRGDSVLDRAADRLSDLPADARSNAASFLDAARALLDQLDANAGTVLRNLTDAIGYEQALRERSVRPERGEARVRTVRALHRYADQFDRPRNLLHGVKALADARRARPDDQDALELRSIHRAKGAEWPVVIVPGCVEGTLPHAPDACSAAELEEERRLFYVALTRTQERLYLARRDDADRSRFLDEAELDTQLPLCRAVRRGLTKDPAVLSDGDAARLCHGLHELDLDDYLRTQWTPAPDHTAALRDRLDALTASVHDARDRLAAYRTAHDEYEQNTDALQSEVDERIDELRALIGTAPLTAEHDAPSDTYYPDDARFTFQWTEDETNVAVYWQDDRIGTLNPIDAGRLDTDTLLSLPWTVLIGQFDGMGPGRRTFRFTIDWSATRDTLLDARYTALSPPDPPSDLDRLLADDAFQTGFALLQNRLSSLPASA